MPRTAIPLNRPIFKLADDEAGLLTGDAYECQLTSATITATSNMNTIPATGCSGASQSPGSSSWQLDLAWLQDWSAASGGLSGYAYTNDTVAKYFEFTLDSADPTTVATGQVYVTAGAYGGEFGTGAPATATATWPCVDKPDISFPALAAATAQQAAADQSNAA